MRTFRKAALASATALALTLGSTSVAVAQTTIGDGTNTTSSKIGQSLDADEPADGTNIFGSSKNLSEEPAWAQALYIGTVAAAATAFFGGIVGPIYNFFVHGPIQFR